MRKAGSLLLIALIALAAITMATLSFAQATSRQKNVTVYVKATAGGTVTYSPTGTGSGTVKAGTTAQFIVPCGTKVMFTAKPQTGFTFGGWSGAGQSGITNPLTIVAKENIGSSCQPLTATFGPKQVLPESYFGALAALCACFAALLVYKRKSLPHLNVHI